MGSLMMHVASRGLVKFEAVDLDGGQWVSGVLPGDVITKMEKI